jgi:hypothetical protein
MSKRNQKRCNLDVLTNALRTIDAAHYDHPQLTYVMEVLGNLDPSSQKIVIMSALTIPITYSQLMDHVRQQFVVLRQQDRDGSYCGLGFGEKCVSIATWNSHNLPHHADEVIVTPHCIQGKNGKLRCGHFLDFAELWIDKNGGTFGDFLSKVKVEDYSN